MKKLLISLALAAGLSTSAFGLTVGATDTEGAKDIVDIVVGDLFELTVLTLAADGAGIIADQGSTGIDSTGGIYFGTLVDLTPAGITADPAATQDGQVSYQQVAHRTGNGFTDSRMFVNNNAATEWDVRTNITSGWLALTPPSTAGVVPADDNLGSQSVIHAITRVTTAIDDGAATSTEAITEGWFTPGNHNPVADGVDLVLFDKDTLTSQVGDAFGVFFVLNFLPLDVPAGTYGGSATHTLTANAV